LTNNPLKLKTTSSFKKTLDAAHVISLEFKQFIAKNGAGLCFSKLFDFRVVRCAKVGIIHTVFHQIGGWRLPFEKAARRCRAAKGLSEFLRTFMFLKVPVSLFSFSE
jgi:hypothetical protein